MPDASTEIQLAELEHVRRAQPQQTARCVQARRIGTPVEMGQSVVGGIAQQDPFLPGATGVDFQRIEEFLARVFKNGARMVTIGSNQRFPQHRRDQVRAATRIRRRHVPAAHLGRLSGSSVSDRSAV